MSKRKSQQQLLMVEQEEQHQQQHQQPHHLAHPVATNDEPAAPRRFTRSSLKRQKLNDDHDENNVNNNDDNADNAGRGNANKQQQQSKQPLLPQPKQKKSQEQLQQQPQQAQPQHNHEQHQHQSQHLPQADTVSDQTAHDMHNLLYSKTCCSNCTIQKQTCAFLQTISAEHQRLRRRKQQHHSHQQQSSPPTLLQAPSETSQPFRFAYEQEGREVDTTKLSFATRLNHTTLSTNRFLLNDIGNIFQQLLVLRDDTLHNKLCNNFYSQHVRGYQAFRNVQLSIKINNPHTGDSCLLPQTFPGDTTIDDVMQYLFYEQGKKEEEQNKDNKNDQDNTYNNDNINITRVNNTTILKDIPTLPFHPYAMGLSLSKPSRARNFNSRHAALSPYITTTTTTTKTTTKKNKQQQPQQQNKKQQQCLPFFFTLYQCFDHDENDNDDGSDNDDMSDNDENNNNNNNDPTTTALLPSNWKYTNTNVATTTTTTTTTTTKLSTQTSQQNELKLSSYPTLLPLEFDLVYNNNSNDSKNNNNNISNIDQFKNTTFYKELLQPVLAQKRTLKDIFIHGKAYQEEDDDGYTPERRMQNLPRENGHVELLYETTTTFDDLFLQNLNNNNNNNFNNVNKNNRNNTNNNNTIATQLTQDYNNAQQQYENNMRVNMLKLQHLDQIKVDFVMSLCLGLRFEIKVMNAYMAHPGETLLALQRQDQHQQPNQPPSQQQQQNPQQNQPQPQQSSISMGDDDEEEDNEDNDDGQEEGYDGSDEDDEEEENGDDKGEKQDNDNDGDDDDDDDDNTTTQHANTPADIVDILAAREAANEARLAAFKRKKRPRYTLFCINDREEMTEWSGNKKTTTWQDLRDHPTFFQGNHPSPPGKSSCMLKANMPDDWDENLNNVTLDKLDYSSGRCFHLNYAPPRQKVNVQFVGQSGSMTIRNCPSTMTIHELRRRVDMSLFAPPLTRGESQYLPALYHPDDPTKTPYTCPTSLYDLISLTTEQPSPPLTTQDKQQPKKRTTLLLGLTPNHTPPPHPMQIFVKTLMGKTITLDVMSDELVEELHGKIQDREGIPPEQQKIVFAGSMLFPGAWKGLDEYGVKDGATLHLVLTLRGC